MLRPFIYCFVKPQLVGPPTYLPLRYPLGVPLRETLGPPHDFPSVGSLMWSSSPPAVNKSTHFCSLKIHPVLLRLSAFVVLKCFQVVSIWLSVGPHKNSDFFSTANPTLSLLWDLMYWNMKSETWNFLHGSGSAWKIRQLPQMAHCKHHTSREHYWLELINLWSGIHQVYDGGMVMNVTSSNTFLSSHAAVWQTSAGLLQFSTGYHEPVVHRPLTL